MYYFASDMHLGLGPRETSLAREKAFVGWLEHISADAEAVFIAGDMFDFWHEYKRVIPKGFSRTLGALSSLTDKGVEVHFFPGNHDMWAYDYLTEECGVTVHHKPGIFDICSKRIFITHGDDISARAAGFWTRIMNGAFRSPAARWLFAKLVPPNQALRLGQAWSSRSRKSKAVACKFHGEADPMIAFARRYLREEGNMDYFFFGHNHCAEIYHLDEKASAIFLGEWINDPVYATMDTGGGVSLQKLANE